MDELALNLSFTGLDLPYSVKKELLERFGTPSKIYAVARGSCEIANVFGRDVNRSMERSPDEGRVREEIERVKKAKARVLIYGSQDYPDLLGNLPDPPLILYAAGKDIPRRRLKIAVVGSRKSTRYGLENAYRLSFDLANRGAVVVSGMALGADASAHRGCLCAGGHTVAVLGSGLSEPYPKTNVSLFREIVQKGTVLSEFSMTDKPRKENFPRRNRIISGLCHGTVVCEASLKSGARITARLALEQNREVFAFPGRIDSQTSMGTNDMIKRGLAKLISECEDIVCEFSHLGADLELDPETLTEASDDRCTGDEKKVLSMLTKGCEVEIEWLANKMNLKYGLLLDIIFNLELKGLISKRPGNMILKEK